VALTDLSRCSAASLHRGDPQTGTAPVAKRWLLVEHQGPWAKAPMDTEPLLGRVGAEVEAVCAQVGGKVLLVRRPTRRPPGDEERHWYAVDMVRRTWVRGIWRTTTDLLSNPALLSALVGSPDARDLHAEQFLDGGADGRLGRIARDAERVFAALLIRRRALLGDDRADDCAMK
jgi:hypothetical protein